MEKSNYLKKSRNFVLATLMLLAALPSMAQILEPVKWDFKTKELSEDRIELQFIASLEPKWHLYSQDVPEDGPVPTSFNITESENFELTGSVEEPEPIEEFDPNFDMVVKYHGGEEVVFTQEVKVLTDEPFTISGFMEYMCCDDSRCLPPTEVDFSFPVNGAEESAATESEEEDAMFEAQEIEGEKEDQAKSAKQSHEASTSGKETQGMMGFFIFSVLAGLAAILTPCVFPMIPMTVTFFMHDTKHKGSGRLQAVVYGLSIILIYTAVGTIVAVAFGASFANWLSTHWIPNVLFFLVFLFFAASFLGMFELTLPSWLINKSDKQADRGGITGSFFMAFTLVLVSFSCTGPLVGAILVESAGGDFLKPIIGMLGFSAAFALPFTLFAFFPKWLSGMPKSGGWLNNVKVVLGLLELALGFKFLSIADQTYHWGILDREIYLAIWIVIFTILGFYLLGKIKFANDSDVKHVTVPRLSLAIITFTFVVYMIPGLFGAPLKALSGYLPPQHTQDFDINTIVRDNLKVANYSSGGQDAVAVSEDCKESKYSDFLHLPHGLDGYFDFEQGMECARKQNKPVFIDFTGHGCVNCREMEANVWSDPRVLKRLRDDYVIIALYVDDKSRLDESEWVKSSYDGKVKKTLGKKYADFQIRKFGVNAQPYYVLLDHNEEKLVEPRAYSLDVDEFVDFLDRGIEEFEEQN